MGHCCTQGKHKWIDVLLREGVTGEDLKNLQALRQSLLKKYARIRADMDSLHNKRLSPYEKIETLESIRGQIQGAWRTDEIRRQKPSPQATTPLQYALMAIRC